ncbi:hypothetical protein [Thermocrinis sp.]
MSLFSLSFGAEVCIKNIDNPFPEGYLTYAVRRTVEQAFLQAGAKLACKQGSEDVSVVISEFKDIPVGLSPFQRVNAYNLRLSFVIKQRGEEKNYGTTVSYSLPSGAEGDTRRRFAIDDALSIIYLRLVEDLSRRYRDVHKP